MRETDLENRFQDLLPLARKMERKGVTGRKLRQMTTKKAWRNFGADKDTAGLLVDEVKNLFEESESDSEDEKQHVASHGGVTVYLDGSRFRGHSSPKPSRRRSISQPKEDAKSDAILMPDSKAMENVKNNILKKLACSQNVPTDFLDKIKITTAGIEEVMVPVEISKVSISGAASYTGSDGKTQKKALNHTQYVVIPCAREHFSDASKFAFFQGYHQHLDKLEKVEVDELEEDVEADNVSEYHKREKRESYGKDLVLQAVNVTANVKHPQSCRRWGQPVVALVPVLRFCYTYKEKTFSVMCNPLEPSESKNFVIQPDGFPVSEEVSYPKWTAYALVLAVLLLCFSEVMLALPQIAFVVIYRSCLWCRQGMRNHAARQSAWATFLNKKRTLDSLSHHSGANEASGDGG